MNKKGRVRREQGEGKGWKKERREEKIERRALEVDPSSNLTIRGGARLYKTHLK